ncbi:MAG: alanine racemase, partial [Candidatus Odinarchaeota archaeon]
FRSFDVIETVSRKKIFYKIVHYASLFDKPMKILLEVNPSAEESKSGLTYGEIESFLEEIELNSPETYQPVKVEGFMTIGNPFLAEKEKRLEFREFVSRMKVFRKKFPMIGKQLSFGMSSDYRIALEEGSTEVRLGTTLFGPRE